MNDRVTAYAQIVLSALFIAGYFATVAAFLLGKVQVAPEFKDAFTALLGVLTANVVQICSYWFARQRSATGV